MVIVCFLARGTFADVTFEQAWSRETPNGATTAAVYGAIANHGDSAVSVASILCSSAEQAMLHETVMKGDVMKMQHADGVVIKAGETLSMVPGGSHVMLIGLHEPLKKGDVFPVTVTLSDGTEVSAQVVVGSIGQMTMPTD